MLESGLGDVCRSTKRQRERCQFIKIQMECQWLMEEIFIWVLHQEKVKYFFSFFSFFRAFFRSHLSLSLSLSPLSLSLSLVANKVITVGTTSRAEIIASFFDESPPPLRVNSSRGFLTITGYYQGERISVVAIGMVYYSHDLHNLF